jgi:hypothetical protein
MGEGSEIVRQCPIKSAGGVQPEAQEKFAIEEIFSVRSNNG